MPSFISNFKGRSARERRLAGRLALFAGAFLFLAALGLFLASHLKGDRVWRGRCFDLPEKGGILDEVDSDHFDGYDRLYYGIGLAVENARRADILLLGNSRVLFAFRAPAVRAFEQKSGLKVFNFCFPANDGLVMAWEAIQRNDLRPSLVVVNENQFFDLGRSPYGTGTVEEGRWGAWTRVWEDGMSWDARCWLHRFFPRFGFGDLYPAQPTVTVQSSRDGCLLYEDFSRGRSVYPIHGTGAWDHPSAEELELAREFKAFLAARGARLVLTNIPYDMGSYVMARGEATADLALFLTPENLKPFHKAVKLAASLQVPLLVPPLGGMHSLDGSHLDARSAERFASGFFRLLGRDLRRAPAGRWEKEGKR